ncbi:MAG: peptidase S10, partial [Desulfovibrionales bacterium]
SPELIDKNDLRISFLDFVKNFLQERELVLGRMDATVIGVDPDPSNPYAYMDPSLEPLFGPFSAAVNSYVRQELRYEQLIPYEFLNEEVTGNWDWSTAVSGKRRGQGYLNVADDLKSAMNGNPYLKVLVAGGWFDLATPYFAILHTISQMDLNEEIRENLTVRLFKAGHMIYLHDEARRDLFEEVRAFYGWAVPERADR